jgi:hypothetical protein
VLRVIVKRQLKKYFDALCRIFSLQQKRVQPSGGSKPSDPTNVSIESVVLTSEPGDVLMATIRFHAPDDSEFRFYVLRNGQRIHRKRYSPEHVLRFETHARPGLYRVRAFVRTSEGAITTKYSNPMFLNPIVYTVGSTLTTFRPEEGALLLCGRHWKYPALYYSGSEQRSLYVMLSAMIDRKKHGPPVFNRWTWAEKKMFPGHVLCVSDPTLELHNGLDLGWYLGTAEHDASEDLAEVIRGFAAKLGVPDDRIVIWGSSGGGFSALAVASRIKKATAVAINAQTDIFTFKNSQAVEAVKKSCFGGQSVKHIREHFGPRVNMAQAWKSNRSSRAILLQNTLDAYHYTHHFIPFWEALGGKTEGGEAAAGRLYGWLYSDPRGHAPEPEQMIPEILDLINQEPFPESLRKPGIHAVNE